MSRGNIGAGGTIYATGNIGAGGNIDANNINASSGTIGNFNSNNSSIKNITTDNIYPWYSGNVNINRLNTTTWLRLRPMSNYGHSLDENGGVIRGWDNNGGPNQQWTLGNP